jgi:hypothetical protein
MMRDWREVFDRAVNALLKTDEKAIVYFTRNDLLGELVGPVSQVWELPETQKILKKQRSDGSWEGPAKKTPVYPENHSDLVASFKAFRILVERYGFTRASLNIEKAEEYLFGFQTSEGDIRGFIANQYATYYTGEILSLLIKAGYTDDPRIEHGMNWLLGMRQDDGGWTVPILTHTFDKETKYRLTSSYMEPVEPDRTKPFSHNWTDMVLRAFAIHPVYCHSDEIRKAGELLKSRFFQPDMYNSYRDVRYWTRFAFWWPNLLTSMESLLLLGFSNDDLDIQKGLEWFLKNQQDDGLWNVSSEGRPGTEGKPLERTWLTLRICRILKGFLADD